MLKYIESTWPDSHVNQSMHSSVPGTGFPDSERNVLQTTIPFAKGPTEWSFGTYTHPDHYHWLICFSLPGGGFTDLKNQIMLLKWDPAHPNHPDHREPQKAEGVQGFVCQVMVRGKPKVIAANAQDRNIVVLDPYDLNPVTTKGKTRKILRPTSRWKFRGMAKSMTFLKGGRGKPDVMFITTKDDDKSRLYKFNPDSLEKLGREQIFKPRINSRIAVDDQDRVYLAIGRTIERHKYDYDKNEFVPDRPNYVAEYGGGPAGVSPTLVGDYVLVTNNEMSFTDAEANTNPDIGDEDRDLTVFCFNRRNMRLVDKLSPFPKTRVQRLYAFNQSSLNAHRDGSYVIVYSWMLMQGKNPDPRTGVARVNVSKAGKLSLAWKDPIPGDKRVGALAYEQGVFAFPYRRANQTRVRALSVDKTKPGTGGVRQPRLLWDRKLDHAKVTGLVTAGDGYFVVGNVRSVNLFSRKGRS